MRKSDETIVAEAGQAKFAKALEAAARSLRADGRMTGLPRIRSRLEEICALRALGSNIGLGKADMEGLARDVATYNAVTAATDAAVKAAKEAIGE